MKPRIIPVDQYDGPQPTETDCCEDGWIAEPDEFEFDEETGHWYPTGRVVTPCPHCNPEGDEQ